MFAKIIIDQDAKALDKVFEYKIPQDMQVGIGERVIVPFGSRYLQGFIVAIEDKSEYDESKIKTDTYDMMIQVNGKLRGSITADVNESDDEIKQAALANDNVQKFTAGKDIKKIIVVPRKIVNIVAK